MRRTEITAALSVAADAGMGHPADLTLASAAVAARLARALGLGDADVRACHEVALLRFAGCTSDSDVASKVFGDEVSARRAIATADFGHASSVIGTAFRKLHAEDPLVVRLPKVLRAVAGMGALFGSAIAHCEVAQGLARSLGYDDRVVAALALAFERWDGRGIPRRLREDEIPLEVHVSSLAHDFTLFHRLFGRDAALEMAEERSGGAHDPALVAALARHQRDLFDVLDAPSPWTAALDAEPEPHARLEGDAPESAVAALGDFADLKGATRAGHSRSVATLVDRTARRTGMSDEERRDLRWAAYAHDLGVAATTASVWDKPSPLTDAERESIRIHPYLTERCLARGETLERIGRIAALHHERLDGSGYPKTARADALGRSARLLAVADAVVGMGSDRPHRRALPPERVVKEIESAVTDGTLCGSAARDVLDAMGASANVALPGGLTSREIEVLRHLALGKTMKETAVALGIATKTADNHAQRIYAKIGVTTRGAAALWAMRTGIVRA